MSLSTVLALLTLIASDPVSAGGGNAGAPNCWFYRDHFNASLESYKKQVAAWVQHIEDIEMVYVAKNPLRSGAILRRRLEAIVEENVGMFDTYKRNIVEETAMLCGVRKAVIEKALLGPQTFAFPVYCLTNIGQVTEAYEEALKEVESDKNSFMI